MLVKVLLIILTLFWPPPMYNSVKMLSGYCNSLQYKVLGMKKIEEIRFEIGEV